jgi:hypothetical protein
MVEGACARTGKGKTIPVATAPADFRNLRRFMCGFPTGA